MALKKNNLSCRMVNAENNNTLFITCFFTFFQPLTFLEIQAAVRQSTHLKTGIAINCIVSISPIQVFEDNNTVLADIRMRYPWQCSFN
ncbi:hypothetical protein Y032_0151g2817 [Ancylostoma ceylanicum]|nr:hypothetical protein Y032_0151g2817 [Ancylostoma ceylanicum]